MATHVVMPKLGLTMERGTVVKWYKVEGQAVHEGEPLAQIETDKITNDMEAPASGVLLKILVAEGQEVEVLLPIAIIGSEGEI